LLLQARFLAFHQKPFGDRALPGPAGELERSPAAIGGLLLRGGKGKGGERTGGEGRERGRNWKGGDGTGGKKKGVKRRGKEGRKGKGRGKDRRML